MAETICCVCLDSVATKVAHHCPSCTKASCYDCLLTYCGGIKTVPQCPHCQIHIPNEVLWDLAALFNPIDPKAAYRAWLQIIRDKVPGQIIAQSGELKERTFRLTQLTDQLGELLDLIMAQPTTEARAEYRAKFRQLSTEKHKILTNNKTKLETQTVIACTAPGCRGLVGGGAGLATHWTCTLCHSQICSKCRVVVPSESTQSQQSHVCDPNELKSVQELLLNTKACPNCHTRIYKTSGCDQMWCVSCNTAFNWTTGQKMSTVNFHNAHYQDWLNRTRGKTLVFDDAQCLELIPLDVVQGRVIDPEAYSKYYEWLTELNMAQTNAATELAELNQRQTNSLTYYFKDSDHCDIVERTLFECYQRMALVGELQGFRAMILPVGISLINTAGRDGQDNSAGNLVELEQLHKMHKERVEKLQWVFAVRV